MAGLVALIHSHAGALAATLDVLSVSQQMPTGNGVILWYPPYPIAPRMVVGHFSFLPTSRAPTSFDWVLWVSVSAILMIGSPTGRHLALFLQPISPQHRLFGCRFVSLGFDATTNERSNCANLAFRPLAPQTMWRVDQHW